MKTSIKLSARSSLAEILEKRREKLDESIQWNAEFIEEVSDPEIRKVTRENTTAMIHEKDIINSFLELLENGAV